MSFEYFDELSLDDRKRYIVKLDAIQLKMCPENGI